MKESSLFTSLFNDKFSINFFDGDEFGTESCYAALMVLKSYSIIYRLQNNNFDEIDYSKINFDINDNDVNYDFICDVSDERLGKIIEENLGVK